MIGGLMNSKYYMVLLLLLTITFSANVFLQNEKKEVKVSDSVVKTKNEKEIGIGWAINTKYKYSEINLKYYTSRFIWKKQIRLRFDFEGYRITDYIITEYSRLTLQADYKIDFPSKNNLIHYILPKAGISLMFDMYDGSSPTNGLSYAPNIGIDYEGRLRNFQFQGKNTISFFNDGLWYELNPGISYRIFKNIYLKASANIIFAYTYNGNSAIGFFPGASINIFPVRKKTNKR